MQNNRSRDTKPEMAVRSAVHRRGIRYRVAVRPQPELARTADLVLRKSRIAVFVDGCFWHGCPDHHTQPATNSRYWADKIARNAKRDIETTAYLPLAVDMDGAALLGARGSGGGGRSSPGGREVGTERVGVTAEGPLSYTCGGLGVSMPAT